MSDTILLTAVGDISVGDHPAFVSVGMRSRYEQAAPDDPDYPFGGLAGAFRDPDLVFGNLETVLSDAGLQPGELRSREMRGAPGVVPRLARAGFNVLNVANNHILQHGAEAFRDTVGALQECGIAVTGLAAPGGRQAEMVIVDRRGIRVAFVGYAFEPDKYFAGRPLYAFGPDCDIPADIARARDAADLVVCSMHWGDEFIRRPTAANVQLGRRLIDAGAHVVLGHHPHVYHGIERYRGGVIAYSLGNFVFDMPWDKWLRYGLVVDVRLSRRGVEGMAPRFVHIDADYQPRLVADAGDLLQDLARLSTTIDEPLRDDQYQAEYRRLVRSNRIRTYMHLLRQSRRYDTGILRQILQRPVASRLTRSTVTSSVRAR